MKAKSAIPVLACVALVLLACGSSPRNLIVGQWEAVKAKAGGDDVPYTELPKGIRVAAQFSPDATARITMMGQMLQGTYRLDGDELEWSLRGITKKTRAKVTATELEVTDDDNQTILYKRK